MPSSQPTVKPEQRTLRNLPEPATLQFKARNAVPASIPKPTPGNLSGQAFLFIRATRTQILNLRHPLTPTLNPITSGQKQYTQLCSLSGTATTALLKGLQREVNG